MKEGAIMAITEMSTAEEVVEEIRRLSAELAWRDNDALVLRIDETLLGYLGNLSVPKRGSSGADEDD
jgi:hypothetical protein